MRNLVARRAYTIEERRQLSACRWALRLWDAAVRASAREDCASIAERVRRAREAAASWEEARASCQRHRRSAEESRLRAAELRAEVGVVLSELQEEQEAKVHWAHEAATAQAEAALRLQQGRRDLAGIERQLEEAVNMQMSLRFVLRQGEAEAEAVRARRGLQEERSAELTDRLNEAQSAYVHAIDLLDATVIRLEREGQAAEGKAHHVEDALDEAPGGRRDRDRPWTLCAHRVPCMDSGGHTRRAARQLWKVLYLRRRFLISGRRRSSVACATSSCSAGGRGSRR